MAVEFFTCSYSEFKPRMGLPVRITIGAPRYKLGYDLAGQLPQLAPTGPMMKMSDEEFEVVYRERLDKLGVTPIYEAAQVIVDRNAGDPRVVLLCFENFSRNPKFSCHRHMFAEWWQQKTGETVRELGTQPGEVARLF